MHIMRVRGLIIIAIRNVLSIDILCKTRCYICNMPKSPSCVLCAAETSFIAEGRERYPLFIPSRRYTHQVVITVAFDIARTVTRRTVDLSSGVEKMIFCETKAIEPNSPIRADQRSISASENLRAI